MSEPTHAVAKPAQTDALDFAIAITSHGVQLTNLDDAWKFARFVWKSGLTPRGLDSPQKVLVAILYGLELGLSPLTALHSIAVMDSRPVLWGDGLLAVCRMSPVWNDTVFAEVPILDKDGNITGYACTVGRKDGTTITRQFTIEDAKRAGLWGKTYSGKPSPWVSYPYRMLQMRARSWALRDCFADLLKGVYSAEEMADVVETQESTQHGVDVVRQALSTGIEGEPHEQVEDAS